ncbi:MAG: ribonuclease HII [Pseudomonadota bacterium]
MSRAPAAWLRAAALPPAPARLCGVDEAGRGPLAGPVCAAAVILDPAHPIRGLADSKRLSPAARDRLAPVIRGQAIAWAVAFEEAIEIDAINILQATLRAMSRAVAALGVAPDAVWVDGNRVPGGLSVPALAVLGGEDRVPAISAASILAKTARDARMDELARRWPGYGFEQHRGYPTASHLEALGRLGPCPEHRRSFGPVARLCAAGPAPAVGTSLA